MNPDRKNLIARVISAVIGLPIIGLIVFWHDSRGMAALCLLAAVLGMREFTAMTMKGRPAAERAGVVLVGAGLYLALFLRPDWAALWAMAAMIFVSLLILSGAGDGAPAGGRLLSSGFGVFYVGGLLAALPLLHKGFGPAWVALAIAVTFINDTGAYFAGRAFGRHKLAPAISPGKTVEGALGGLAASVTMTFVTGATFLPALSIRDRVVIGCAAGVVGPAGDLVESLLKRSAGVKDSGRIIPGHGGILDRIDALLFVSAYVLLHAILLR